MHLVFLLEEQSAKQFLDLFLPRILPDEATFLTVPHQGKSELQKSIPRKLRAWRTPDTKFVILHDQDSADCTELKESLVTLCEAGGKPALVRIACRELEAWYLGDLHAVDRAYPGSRVARVSRKARYRNPDTIVTPSKELERIVPEFQKVDGARRLATEIVVEDCGSPSFRAFVDGVLSLVE
ncbi:MAG: hypothetical protein CMQ43_13440 [Gammaproteobacteria bacterium]|nr:hypothetical protein [Gammaproteobacteria bacterium]MBK81905.1 hypothetical protein [Gammaproteobacteria bacterium]